MKRWRTILFWVVLGWYPSGLHAQSFWQDLEDMWYQGKVYQGQLMEARSSVTSGVNSYSRSIYVSTRLPGNHYGRYEIVKGGLKINFGNSCQGFSITADIFGKVDVDELVHWVTDLSMNTLYATLLSYVYSVHGAIPEGTASCV